MFLCQNDEYQPTTERQPKRNAYFLTPQANADQVTRGWGKGEESNFELVYFKLALLKIAIETIVCRVTVISRKKQIQNRI